MSGLICPKCGERIDLFKRGGGLALAGEMGVPALGQIPIDPEVVMAGDAGIPLLRDGPQSPAAKAFSQVVDSILSPTYGEYERAAKMMGAVVRPVWSRAKADFRHSRGEISRQLSVQTHRLVFICNPNNPTGSVFPLDVLAGWAQESPDTLSLKSLLSSSLCLIAAMEA